MIMEIILILILYLAFAIGIGKLLKSKSTY